MGQSVGVIEYWSAAILAAYLCSQDSCTSINQDTPWLFNLAFLQLGGFTAMCG
jgi:hypothetical protein